VSQDPKGFAAGDTDLYRYVGNDPTGTNDPSGLVDPDWWQWFKDVARNPAIPMANAWSMWMVHLWNSGNSGPSDGTPPGPPLEPPQPPPPAPPNEGPPPIDPPSGPTNGPSSGPTNGGPSNGPTSGPSSGPTNGPTNGPVNGPRPIPQPNPPAPEGPGLPTGSGGARSALPQLRRRLQFWQWWHPSYIFVPSRDSTSRPDGPSGIA
jgi:hypothetical protein